MSDAPISYFATAERASHSEIARQARLLEKTPHLRQLYDSVTDIVLILNPQRQIVFANRRMADLLGLGDCSPLHGMRPGEALGCHYACGAAGGCGTTEFCAACGAVNAVLSSQAGHEDARECNILRGEEREALELLIRATPLDLDGERFTIVAATDISHEKRRRALERTFFHDLMNTAMGLKLFTRSLAKAPPSTPSGRWTASAAASSGCWRRSRSSGTWPWRRTTSWPPRPAIIRSLHLVEGLTDHYGEYSEPHHCPLRRAEAAEDFGFKSDPTLLSRVLGNMVKNALEASEDGQPVTIGCAQADGRVRFWVHNHGVIPRQVQLQVFQRSFTTKGEGRGLGTYSMKLLSERYLQGQRRVHLDAAEHGTTFTADLPADAARQVGPRRGDEEPAAQERGHGEHEQEEDTALARWPLPFLVLVLLLVLAFAVLTRTAGQVGRGAPAAPLTPFRPASGRSAGRRAPWGRRSPRAPYGSRSAPAGP